MAVIKANMALSTASIALLFQMTQELRVCNTTAFASWLFASHRWEPEHAQSTQLDKELGSRHTTTTGNIIPLLLGLPCMLLPYTQKKKISN